MLLYAASRISFISAEASWLTGWLTQSEWSHWESLCAAFNEHRARIITCSPRAAQLHTHKKVLADEQSVFRLRGCASPTAPSAFNQRAHAEPPDAAAALRAAPSASHRTRGRSGVPSAGGTQHRRRDATSEPPGPGTAGVLETPSPSSGLPGKPSSALSLKRKSVVTKVMIVK